MTKNGAFLALFLFERNHLLGEAARCDTVVIGPAWLSWQRLRKRHLHVGGALKEGNTQPICLVCKCSLLKGALLWKSLVLHPREFRWWSYFFHLSPLRKSKNSVTIATVRLAARSRASGTLLWPGHASQAARFKSLSSKRIRKTTKNVSWTFKTPRVSIPKNLCFYFKKMKHFKEYKIFSPSIAAPMASPAGQRPDPPLCADDASAVPGASAPHLLPGR